MKLIKKAQKFVASHKVGTSVVTGALTGYFLSRSSIAKPKNHLDEIVELYVTPEQVGKMLLGGGRVEFETPKGSVAVYLSEDSET